MTISTEYEYTWHWLRIHPSCWGWGVSNLTCSRQNGVSNLTLNPPKRGVDFNLNVHVCIMHRTTWCIINMHAASMHACTHQSSSSTMHLSISTIYDGWIACYCIAHRHSLHLMVPYESWIEREPRKIVFPSSVEQNPTILQPNSYYYYPPPPSSDVESREILYLS